MLTILVFVSAIIVYFVVAYAVTRSLKKLIVWNFGEPLTVKRSNQVVAGFMTIFSLVAVVLLPKKAFLTALALPGVYGGLVLSMLLGGERHGPGDAYSWLLFAAPINLFFYYALVRVIGKNFPSLF